MSLYHRKKQLKAEIAKLHREIELHPHDVNLLYARGNTWLELLEYKKGVMDLEEALEYGLSGERADAARELLERFKEYRSD